MLVPLNAFLPTLASCPWNGFTPSEIDFCENNLCSWIVEPANSWSCIAYAFWGGLILYRSHKEGLKGPFSYFGYIALLIGLFSLAYHATLTFVGSLLDLGSMYLFLSNIIHIIVQRLSIWANKKLTSYSALIFWSFNLALLGITFIFESATGLIYLGLVLSVLSMEIFLLTRERNIKKHYRWLLAAFGMYVFASYFWYLDTYRVYCQPDNHVFNGHVVWHFGSAFCIFAVFMHYKQFSTTVQK